MTLLKIRTWITYAAAAAAIAGTAGCASTVKVAKPKPMDFTHGSTLDLAGGVASASSNAGGVIGGDLGWEITPGIAIQGSSAWLDRGPAATAFAAALTGQFSLRSPHATVPFVEGGFGMYRAAFDSPRGAIPGFYADRIAPGANGESAFRDPLFVVGAGLNFFATPRIAVRPAAELFIVTRGSQAYTVAMFTVRTVYHFEKHPAAP